MNWRSRRFGGRGRGPEQRGCDSVEGRAGEKAKFEVASTGGAGNSMQGMVGNYLEKNMQAFVQVQKQLQEQSRAMYGDNSKINKDLWAQFMNFQGSAMQGMMSAYMDQSKNVFMQMQEQLQNQTKNIFSGFSFPGFPG